MIYLPSSVDKQSLVDWIVESSESSMEPGVGIRLESGSVLYVVEADLQDLRLSYEGESQRILEHCLDGRKAWYLTYRNTSGSIRGVVAHVAMRWPIYVDTDHYEVLTGAEFVKRLCDRPDWDLADSGSDLASLIAAFRY